MRRKKVDVKKIEEQKFDKENVKKFLKICSEIFCLFEKIKIWKKYNFEKNKFIQSQTVTVFIPQQSALDWASF